jgi:hypothetical protein
MNKVFLTLTISALVLGLSTADAVWGNTNRTVNTNGTYVQTPVISGQVLDQQRLKHQAQNAYYVQQNGGTVTTDSSVTTPIQTSGQIPTTATQYSNIPTSQIAGNAALLIQTARLATIERDMYGNTDGFVLTLKGVEPNLAFFNNNGQRMIGKVGINDFINSLKSTNGASAALVTTSTTPDNAPDLQESVIILSNPVYDSRLQTLKFNIDNLNGNRLRAGSHQNAVLLIDSTFMNQ